jgi:hypothetical protein
MMAGAPGAFGSLFKANSSEETGWKRSLAASTAGWLAKAVKKISKAKQNCKFERRRDTGDLLVRPYLPFKNVADAQGLSFEQCFAKDLFPMSKSKAKAHPSDKTG